MHAVLACAKSWNSLSRLGCPLSRLIKTESPLQIMNLLPHYVFVKDDTGRFLMANTTVADAYNLPVKEVVGKLHEEVNPDNEEGKMMNQDDLDVITSGQKTVIPGIHRLSYLYLPAVTDLIRQVFIDNGNQFSSKCSAKRILYFSM